MADEFDPASQLILRPGARTLTLSEVLQRIGRFVDQIPDVEFVLLVRRKGDPLERVAACRGGDMPREVVREMLRVSLSAYDRGDVKMERPV